MLQRNSANPRHAVMDGTDGPVEEQPTTQQDQEIPPTQVAMEGEVAAGGTGEGAAVSAPPAALLKGTGEPAAWNLPPPSSSKKGKNVRFSMAHDVNATPEGVRDATTTLRLRKGDIDQVHLVCLHGRVFLLLFSTRTRSCCSVRPLLQSSPNVKGLGVRMLPPVSKEAKPCPLHSVADHFRADCVPGGQHHGVCELGLWQRLRL
jgi:hypothetical protein